MCHICVLVIQEVIVSLEQFNIAWIDVSRYLTNYHVYQQSSHLDVYKAIRLPKQRSIYYIENDQWTCQDSANIEQHQLIDESALVWHIGGMQFLVTKVRDDFIAKDESSIDEDGN